MTFHVHLDIFPETTDRESESDPHRVRLTIFADRENFDAPHLDRAASFPNKPMARGAVGQIQAALDLLGFPHKDSGGDSLLYPVDEATRGGVEA